jgi:hypothetical protein
MPRPPRTSSEKARELALSSLVVGILPGVAAIFTNYLAFGFLSQHYEDATGFAAILFLHVCLVLVSVIGVALGIAALIAQNSATRLAACALTLNLIPLISLIVTIRAAF